MHSLRVVLIDGVGSIIMLMFLYEVEMFLHREVLRVLRLNNIFLLMYL